MSYLDRLVPASFDSIPFYTEDVDLKAGRRQHVQKYPGRAQVNVQDLGADSREIAVNAYVIGPDYDLDRQLLEDALGEGGPKTLVLPRRGSKTVTVVGEIRTRESHKSGGMARISFRCVEYVPEAPFQRADTPVQAQVAADAVKVATSAEFVDKFDYGIPSTYQAASDEAFGAASAAMAAAAERISTATGVANTAADRAASFGENVSGLIGDASGVVAAIDDTITATLGIAPAAVTSLRDAGASAFALGQLVETTLAGARLLFDFSALLLIPGGTSPSAVQQTTNTRQIIDAVRATTCAELVRAATRLPFESREQAVAARDQIAEMIDTASETIGDEQYNALWALAAAASSFLDGVAAQLPETATYTVRFPGLSASEIAHEIYADGSRADEIVERNRIALGYAIEPGTVLEVLAA